MRIIPILILSIFLTGCSWFKKPDKPFVPPDTKVNIDTKVLEPCSLLKEDIKLTTFDEYLLVEYPQIVKQYTDCAIKQSNSVKLIKQLGNIK